MADSLDKFLRTTKRLYEEIKNELGAGQKGIDKLLFPIVDADTNANFALDRYVVEPYGIVFRNPNEQSHVRPYVAGTGNIYEVPRASEKTPISESLRDAVVAGIESTVSQNQHEVKLMSDIIRDHTVGHEITRWKLALDVMRTGKYSPLGIQGNDINLEIDFSRAGACDITYDFTAAGATMDKALKAMHDVLDTYGTSKSNRVVIFGSDWLNQFETDSGVEDRMIANTSNILIEQNMTPPLLQNVKGLYVAGRYRAAGVITPLWILSFSPEGQYIAYKGATAADFMPSDEAIMFSLDTPRYSIYRGIDALDSSGRKIRTVGEIIFDTYNENDPVTEFLRSQTRVAMIPASVNKTVRSTGTFSES